MAKHIIHIKEGAEAAFSTSKHLLEHHDTMRQSDLQNESMDFVHQKLKHKMVQIEVWKLQASSISSRMQNIINLVRIHGTSPACSRSSADGNLSHSILLLSEIATI